MRARARAGSLRLGTFSSWTEVGWGEVGSEGGAAKKEQFGWAAHLEKYLQ